VFYLVAALSGVSFGDRIIRLWWEVMLRRSLQRADASDQKTDHDD
tara:strand:- start:3230 stop:3364 length:135 start_codon:yes stop_codon:yes gene_type:complete